MRRDSLVYRAETFLCQPDQRAATIQRVRDALHQSLFFQLVDTVGHGARCHHGCSEQIAGRKPMRRTCPSQRCQHIETGTVKPVRGQRCLDFARQMRVKTPESPEKAHGSGIEVGSLDLPLLKNMIHMIHIGTIAGYVLTSRYKSKYLDIKINGLCLMSRLADISLTALAPAVWGSTYIVTTQLLPEGVPLTVAALRALPAGLLLLVIVRRLPEGAWWWKSLVLGALNFALFWACLFVAAYRLPGGVAATVGAVQPLVVIGLARVLMGTPIRPGAILAGLAGLGGVAMLVLRPGAGLDLLGVAAGLAGAVSMACGTVLSRHWQPPVSPLTFTAWQLTAGGLLLLPAALLLEPMIPDLSARNLIGFTYLGLIGAAFTYLLWFRGLARIGPSAASALGFLSPLVAVLLGWALLSQALDAVQIVGVVVILASVWVAQRSVAKG